MTRKKILIIENSVHITGALNAVLRTSSALRYKYDFVFVLPRSSKAFSIVKENGFSVFEIPMLELSRRWKSIVFYIPGLIRSAYKVRTIARNQNVSAIHVNDFYNLIMPLWRMFGGSIKYLCYVNFVPDRFPSLLRKIWIKSHLSFSDKIVAVSHHVAKQLPVNDKIVCIPCALPTEIEFQDSNNDRKEKLLFIGNFIEGKGQDLAIRSFALIANSHPGWKLRFVGGDMGMEKNRLYLATLQQLAKDLQLEHQIEWSNFSAHVLTEYQNAAIALNFSRSESFSLTVQEAMFYGCPVIATRSGGPSELIEDRYSGILVPVDDITEMSQSIRFLIENDRERTRLRINAAQSIRGKFNSTKTIDKLDAVYQILV